MIGLQIMSKNFSITTPLRDCSRWAMQIASPTCNSLWIVADLFTDVHLLTLEKQVENIYLLLYLILKNIKNVKVNVMEKKTLK